MSYMTGADLVADAKTRIKMIPNTELLPRVGTPGAPVILDVREPNETNLGRIPGALVIPRGQIETKVEAMIPRDAELVIYCASDNRSALAADTLRRMGYQNVVAMTGGFNAWAGAGGPVE